jgi:hypothetical protein
MYTHTLEHFGTCGHVNYPPPCHRHSTPNSADAVTQLNNLPSDKNDLEDL